MNKHLIETMAKAIYDAWPPTRHWEKASAIQKRACRRYVLTMLAAANGCGYILIPHDKIRTEP